MIRKTLKLNNLKISILDNEKNGEAMICLHGHFGAAASLSFLDAIFPGRVIIPDLRGHGLSEHAPSYRISDYLTDLEEVISALGVTSPIILGHSLGGIIGMCYEAKHHHCKKLIIEDISTEVNGSNDFLNKLPKSFSSIYDINKAFVEILNKPLSYYFMENLYYQDTSWKFRFDYNDMIISQKEMNGSYWNEWKKITCPTLIMKGGKSWATKLENMNKMVALNKMAELKLYPYAGHGIHHDERELFCKDVMAFVNKKNHQPQVLPNLNK